MFIFEQNSNRIFVASVEGVARRKRMKNIQKDLHMNAWDTPDFHISFAINHQDFANGLAYRLGCNFIWALQRQPMDLHPDWADIKIYFRPR